MHPFSPLSAPIPADLVRTIVIENPDAIATLPPPQAAALERVLESSGMEPLLWDVARKRAQDEAAQPRRAAWRTASLLAAARATAYAEALADLEEVSASTGIPFRFLWEPQLSFRVYARPELRPLTSLDVLAPASRARDLQAALRKQRFFELDELADEEPARRRHLRPLERDGVVVKVFERSSRGQHTPPWDRFGPDDLPGAALGLGPEALILLLGEEMAARRYTHSLRLAHGLREVTTRLLPSWQAVVRGAAEGGLEVEALLGLGLAARLLGAEVPPGVAEELAGRAALSSARVDRLLRFACNMCLQYPASMRHVEMMGRLLVKAAAAREAPVQFVA